MTKISRALVVALALMTVACSEEAPPGSDTDLRAKLSSLRDQIAAAQDKAQRYKGAQIGEMEAMRHEILLLSAAMLENRLIAKEGGVPSEIVQPARTPNPARAQQILQYISATEKTLQQAKEKADGRKGVAGKLAESTVVTQELTLAQLQLAYYQAAFGIALPDQTKSTEVAAVGTGTPDSTAAGPDSRPAKETVITERLLPPSESAGAARENEEGSRKKPPSGIAHRANDNLDVSALIDSVKRSGPKKDARKGDDTKAEAASPPEAASKAAESVAERYSHEEFVRIQLLLQEAGFNPGTIDGRWGPNTQNALAEFQRTVGLSPSGQPDSTTLDMLGFN